MTTSFGPTCALSATVLMLALLPGCARPGAAPANSNPAAASASASNSSASNRTKATAAPADPAATAEAAADAFYRAHAEFGSSGLPEGETLRHYRPLLSRRLLALIAEATGYRDAFAAAHPGDKPPYGDGDLFTSLFEGPTGYRLGKRTVLAPDRESIEVELTYSEPRTPDTHWTDRALMLREDGQWKLDDIEYGGQWDFATRGRLSDALRSQE
ncbi:hypothetical protein [Lysobacter capsici]|uniref:hypothetical protein n=1 Tax=Lysobacter capsici TaxID=435897 RepID=UPI001C001AEA|nr:hypothetical protein [Lysobacter capsici]QWF15914.1 hypothetical protein KME82_19370 [Lysobacter capsici]